MRRSMRTLVGAAAVAAASILPLEATAHASPEASAVTAAGWHRRGPFPTYAACDRVRSQQVALGRRTQACYHLVCGAGCTAPGVRTGWYYLIYS